jgi:hypothetical protein
MSNLLVLAVDPGKASGIAVLKWGTVSGSPTPDLVWSVEVQPDIFADSIEEGFKICSELGEYVVACESFVINAQTVRNSQAPWSLENIGVLKHLCRRAKYDPLNIAFQPPVNAKNMFPNPALKKLETWHRGGDGHANDAIRHGLLALVKLGWKPTALLE